MGVKVTNNGFGTISAGINSSATTVVLDSGQGARFPTLGSGDFFFGTLVDTSNNIEIIKVTARSSDSMTITRAQDGTSARAFAIGDRFELRPTAALFESIPYDNNTTSTGSLALPKGTTAQQPAAASAEGHIRYNSDDDVIYFSNGSAWVKIAATIPVLSSISGSIFAGAASTLTLAGTGFMTANLVVNFKQTSDSIDANVTVTPSSDSAASVAVPAAVYNSVTAGNAVTIKVTNADSIASGNQNVTASALPTGGTISSYGSYRVHTFNSGGNFVMPSGLSKTVQALIVAGGGGGGGTNVNGGGGGGAGGMRTTSASITAGTYAVVVGGGGAAGNAGSDGGTSSFNGTSNVGGGGGGYNNGTNGRSGGSGGGSGRDQPSGAGSGTSGQGNNGGASHASTCSGAGGGGGKGGVGQNSNQDCGTTITNNYSGGGVGSNNDYQTGSNIAYAGGGGGAWEGVSTGAQGGTGGGGNGGSASLATATAGATNKGGGGGGGQGNRPASAGGSGVVILRYTI